MSVSSSATRPHARRQHLPLLPIDPSQRDNQRIWLLTIWLILGTLAVLCIPALRADGPTGWTPPFWLIAAPIINLLALAWARRRERQKRR